MSNISNFSSSFDASLDATIRFTVELVIIIFSMSLVICLIVQIKRGEERFDSGFFHIYIILAICDSIGNLVPAVVFHLPVTSIEHFYVFYKEHEYWFCGFVYPIGAASLRISLIGQNFIALNRFTAVFLILKHEEIWSKRNTTFVSCFIIILGVFLQSIAFFGDNKAYFPNFSGCTYGNIIGTNIPVTQITQTTQGTTAGITAIICITLSIATIIKLNLLRRDGTISSRHKRDIPLLVYSVTLTSLEAILAFSYIINSQTLFTGGNIFNQIYGCYLKFYLPKKWSHNWNSTQVIRVAATA